MSVRVKSGHLEHYRQSNREGLDFSFSSQRCAQQPFHISCVILSDACSQPYPLHGGRGWARPAGKLGRLDNPATLQSRLELVVIGQNKAFSVLPCCILCLHKIVVIQRFWLGTAYMLFLNPLRTSGGDMHFVRVWFCYYYFLSKRRINLGLQSKQKP